MGPFLVAIAAIIAWAIVQVAKGRPAAVRPDPEQQQLLQEVLHELEAAQADRKRLTQRVQNLEAIVTTETFDVAREDPEAAAARIDLPELDEEDTPSEQVEHLARRVRP